MWCVEGLFINQLIRGEASHAFTVDASDPNSPSGISILFFVCHQVLVLIFVWSILTYDFVGYTGKTHVVHLIYLLCKRISIVVILLLWDFSFMKFEILTTGSR